jgi:hypothetical protein
MLINNDPSCLASLTNRRRRSPGETWQSSMPRPPLPIGTPGRVRTYRTQSGWRSRTTYKDYDIRKLQMPRPTEACLADCAASPADADLLDNCHCRSRWRRRSPDGCRAAATSSVVRRSEPDRHRGVVHRCGLRQHHADKEGEGYRAEQPPQHDRDDPSAEPGCQQRPTLPR